MRKFPRKGFLMNLVGTETNVFFPYHFRNCNLGFVEYKTTLDEYHFSLDLVQIYERVSRLWITEVLYTNCVLL